MDFAGEPGTAAAWRKIFNLVMTLAVLILLRIFRRRVELFDSTQARSEHHRSQVDVGQTDRSLGSLQPGRCAYSRLSFPNLGLRRQERPLRGKIESMPMMSVMAIYQHRSRSGSRKPLPRLRQKPNDSCHQKSVRNSPKKAVVK